MTKQFKIDTSDTIGKTIDCFLNSDIQSTRFGRYVIENDQLSYRMPVTTEISFNYDKLLSLQCMVHSGAVILVDTTIEYVQEHKPYWIKLRHLKENIIAKRVKTDKGYKFISNMDALSLIGRKICFGNVTYNRYKTEIQDRLYKLIRMESFKNQPDRSPYSKYRR